MYGISLEKIYTQLDIKPNMSFETAPPTPFESLILALTVDHQPFSLQLPTRGRTLIFHPPLYILKPFFIHSENRKYKVKVDSESLFVLPFNPRSFSLDELKLFVNSQK